MMEDAIKKRIFINIPLDNDTYHTVAAYKKSIGNINRKLACYLIFKEEYREIMFFLSVPLLLDSPCRPDLLFPLFYSS